MNIELQVGKRYETRGGQWIAGITDRDETAAGTDNEFLGYVEFFDGDRAVGRTWRADGRFSGEMESVSDLIRELPDASSTPEPAAEPEPVSDTQAPLRLEVGKFYRARDGRVAQVTGTDDGSFYNDFTGHVGTFYCQWNSAGIFDGEHGETVFDLIEEIPAPVADAADTLDFKIKYEPPTISVARPEPPRMDASFTAGEVSPALSESVDLGKYGVRQFPDLGVKLEGDAFKVAFPPPPFETATETSDRYEAEFLIDKADQRLTSRADRLATYARAIMFIMLGVAAVVFAIGTSVQA